ncbi:MAG: DNA repair protein RecO [Spirochaetia bacterium]|nr:DNA repair protein RecO [Spirochaetia bacterium]
MNRNIQCDAMILKSMRSGELHRRLTLISPQLGLFDATAYGARKGSAKLAGLVEPFVHGRVYAYYNPVKQQYSLQDIKVEQFRESLRDDLVDLYSASFFAELILKSFGSGGDHEAVYALMLELLDEIEQKRDHHHLIIQGCWRFLHLFGLAPDLLTCAACGRPLGQAIGSLHHGEHGLWCESCLPFAPAGAALDVASRRYLSYTAELPLQKALRVSLAAEAARMLKNALLHYMDSITDGRLKTIKSGIL